MTRDPVLADIAADLVGPDVKFHSAFRTPNGGYQIRARDVRGRGVEGAPLRLFLVPVAIEEPEAVGLVALSVGPRKEQEPERGDVASG